MSNSVADNSAEMWPQFNVKQRRPSLTSAAFFSACSSFSWASFNDSEYLSSSSSTPFSFFCRPRSSSSSYTQTHKGNYSGGWKGSLDMFSSCGELRLILRIAIFLEIEFNAIHCDTVKPLSSCFCNVMPLTYVADGTEHSSNSAKCMTVNGADIFIVQRQAN